MNNPKSRQQWIYDLLLSEPNSQYVDVWAKYRQKWARGKTTFDKDWKAAQKRHHNYQQKLQKEKEALSIQEDLKPLKYGLKTKNDRLLLLQKQIDATEKELELGVFVEMKKDGDKTLKWERTLTPHEKALLRRTIHQLQSEISKIEGDYAPIKQDVTTQGESLNQSTVDLTKLDLETLKKIKESQKSVTNQKNDN